MAKVADHLAFCNTADALERCNVIPLWKTENFITDVACWSTVTCATSFQSCNSQGVLWGVDQRIVAHVNWVGNTSTEQVVRQKSA